MHPALSTMTAAACLLAAAMPVSAASPASDAAVPIAMRLMASGVPDFLGGDAP